MVKEAKDTKINKVKVNDKIGQEIIKEQIISLEREISQANDSIALKLEGLEDFKIQDKIREEVAELQIKGLFKIKPQHKFEEDPHYWDLQSKLLWYKERQQKVISAGTIVRLEMEIENLRKIAKDAEEKLVKIKGD